ncbi:hypothetical protein, partial [Leptospira inadai]
LGDLVNEAGGMLINELSFKTKVVSMGMLDFGTFKTDHSDLNRSIAAGYGELADNREKYMSEEHRVYSRNANYLYRNDQVMDAIITTGLAACTAIPNPASPGCFSGLVAYKTARGAYEGGVVGAGAAMGSAALTSTMRSTGFGVNFGYSYANGYSAGINYGIPGQTTGIQGGVGYSQRNGWNAKIGYGFKNGANLSYDHSEFGGDTYTGTLANNYGGAFLNYNTENGYSGGINVTSNGSIFGNPLGAFSTLGYGNSGVYNDVSYFVPEKAPLTEAEREQAAESARNNLLNNILGGIGYVAGRVGNAALDFGSYVTGIGLGEGESSLWGDISSGARRIGNGIANFASGVWDGVTGFAKSTWDKTKSFASGTWDWIKSGGKSLLNGAGYVLGWGNSQGNTLLGDLGRGIVKAGTVISDWYYDRGITADTTKALADISNIKEIGLKTENIANQIERDRQFASITGDAEMMAKANAKEQNFRSAVMSEASYLDYNSKEPAMQEKVKAMNEALQKIGVSHVGEDEMRKTGIPQNVIDKFKDAESGMHAELFKYADENGKTKYTVAFRGTEFDLFSTESWKDIGTDIANALGFKTEQYKRAAELAKALSQTTIGSSLDFTGHSLGAGLATMAASMNKSYTATTFNAANVSERVVVGLDGSLSGIENRVNSIYLKGEIVSNIQYNSVQAGIDWALQALGTSYRYNSLIQESPGNRIPIIGILNGQPKTWQGYVNPLTSFQLHGNSAVIDSLYNHYMNRQDY